MLLLAFAGVVVAGILGALIGVGLVGVGCRGDCGTPQALGALIGGLVGTAGVAVVAVLVLRAMTEWKLQGRPIEGLGPPEPDDELDGDDPAGPGPGPGPDT